MSSPQEKWARQEAAICSLNNSLSWLLCGLAEGQPVRKGWVYEVVGELAEQTILLGGSPEIRLDDLSGWKDEE